MATDTCKLTAFPETAEAAALSPDDRWVHSIDSVFLHLTKWCNLRCVYCYFSAAAPLPHEMSAEDYDPLWQDIVKIAPRKVVFTGGEPLLRRDAFELLDQCARYDRRQIIRRCLNTNGLLINDETAKMLVGRVEDVRISIDALKDLNDRMRGGGTFDAAIDAIKRLQNVGFEPKVLITVTAFNVGHLEELAYELIGQGVRRLKFNIVRLIGRADGQRELLPVIDILKSTLLRITDKFSAIGVRHECEGGGVPKSCGVGRFINIMPDGDVFPCHVLTEKEFRIGNVRSERLIDMCRRGGFLHRMSELDLRKIQTETLRANGELLRDPCLGVHMRLNGQTAEQLIRQLPIIA